MGDGSHQGAYARFIRQRENEIRRIPEGLSLRDAALAEPLADAALLASHFSPPSVPLHGATRISTLHEIWVWRLTLLISIFLTVDATMNPRA